MIITEGERIQSEGMKLSNVECAKFLLGQKPQLPLVKKKKIFSDISSYMSEAAAAAAAVSQVLYLLTSPVPKAKVAK